MLDLAIELSCHIKCQDGAMAATIFFTKFYADAELRVPSLKMQHFRYLAF